MGVTVTGVAAAICFNTGDSGGGTSNFSPSLASQVVNGIVKYSGNYYAVTLTQDGKLNVFQSSDAVTWSALGSPEATHISDLIGMGYSYSGASGGIAALLNGNLLYVVYSTERDISVFGFAATHGPNPADATNCSGIFWKALDLDTSTWSAESSYFYESSGDPRPPYADMCNVHLRPDASMVAIVDGPAGGTSGEWNGILAYPLGNTHIIPISGGNATNRNDEQTVYESSHMHSDGTIDILYSGHVIDVDPFYVASLSPSNVVSGETALPTIGGQAFEDGTIGQGDTETSTGNSYVPVCIEKSGGSHPYESNMGLLYHDGTGWHVTGVLDPQSDVMVCTPQLHVVSGYLICVCQLVDESSPAFPPQAIFRVGYVLLSSGSGGATNPANWTWTTIYDFTSPSPAISGATSPYGLSMFLGMSMSFVKDSDGIFRYMCTLKDTAGTPNLIVAHLFDVEVSGTVTLIFNDFD